jgi:hypothetical protein
MLTYWPKTEKVGLHETAQVMGMGHGGVRSHGVLDRLSPQTTGETTYALTDMERME